MYHVFVEVRDTIHTSDYFEKVHYVSADDFSVYEAAAHLLGTVDCKSTYIYVGDTEFKRDPIRYRVVGE